MRRMDSCPDCWRGRLSESTAAFLLVSSAILRNLTLAPSLRVLQSTDSVVILCRSWRKRSYALAYCVLMLPAEWLCQFLPGHFTPSN